MPCGGFATATGPGCQRPPPQDDAEKEKTLAFEETDTYRAIKSVYTGEFRAQPDYAILPQVMLESPKLSRRLSTAWFAQSVERRFQSCLAGAAR